MKRDTGPNALRRGRFSTPGATYFVTVCVAQRSAVLHDEVAHLILAEAQAMDGEGVWRLRCMTIMPDHLHLLATILGRLTLSQAIGRLKAKTGPTLRQAGTAWQANFYDRHLRPDDEVEPIIRYILLNPSAAGLAASGACWPWFHCCADDWSWFSVLTDSGKPFPGWLK
jgi:putative transposase